MDSLRGGDAPELWSAGRAKDFAMMFASSRSISDANEIAFRTAIALVHQGRIAVVQSGAGRMRPGTGTFSRARVLLQ